jgi:hypothetical protein
MENIIIILSKQGVYRGHSLKSQELRIKSEKVERFA